jgi:hypothetical protein
MTYLPGGVPDNKRENWEDRQEKVVKKRCQEPF